MTKKQALMVFGSGLLSFGAFHLFQKATYEMGKEAGYRKMTNILDKSLTPLAFGDDGDLETYDGMVILAKNPDTGTLGFFKRNSNGNEAVYEEGP